ncbi:hypothetical protein [Azospirillum sp. ST 5-10]|uniref:hypothetical protein n=1 Tax=unclassified Azospirillum TaxID=2630922 RepID=UPI003F49C183
MSSATSSIAREPAPAPDAEDKPRKRGRTAETALAFARAAVEPGGAGECVTVGQLYDLYVAYATWHQARALDRVHVVRLWAEVGLVVSTRLGVEVYAERRVSWTPWGGLAGRTLVLPAGLGPQDVVALHRTAAERARQITGEGCRPAADDRYPPGELAAAGAAYALSALAHGLAAGWRRRAVLGLAWLVWPWSAAWWKPRDAGRDLDRAGALLVAEQARRLRTGEA